MSIRFPCFSVRTALLVLGLLFGSQPAFADNPMVHQDGRQIVDGAGNPIKLRGVLLEGWLMWNGTLWGAGLTSQTHIAKKLVELVGEEEAQRFTNQIYRNFITQRDVEMIADMGFNVVRLPVNHSLLEDDTNPYQYKEAGWKILDEFLDWCEIHKVYVVLDLHSAPGGQSGVFVNDPDGSGFYRNEENIARTVSLWRAIADRYRNRTIVAGYDLLNEPQIPWFTPADVLTDIYARIIAAIREVDKQHMVILSGAGVASNDLSLFKTVADSNQALAFHTYNLLGSDIGEATHQQFSRLASKLDVPLWNGEIGAHTAQWVSAVIAMFERPELQISGWIFWPWKRVPEAGNRYRHLMAIESTPKWDAVRNWIAGVWFAPKPSREAALEGMAEFIQAIAPERLVEDQEMRAIVTGFQSSGSE